MPATFLITSTTSVDPIPIQTRVDDLEAVNAWIDAFMGHAAPPLGLTETRTVVITAVYIRPQ